MVNGVEPNYRNMGIATGLIRELIVDADLRKQFRIPEDNSSRLDWFNKHGLRSLRKRIQNLSSYA
ncbi:hypothetical protein N824_01875 [Pedobacter sp. V48]|nr:hypothetical protein N824_01875 [Pedobacter sp. V48]